MAKMMSEEEMRKTSRLAVRYSPGQGSQKKEPLLRRAKMAVMGKHYKTDAAKRSKKKTKANKRRYNFVSGRTRSLVRLANEYGSPEVASMVTGKKKK